MAITEDILRTKFGFNDPNVMKGILSNPGEVARYEREYAQMGGGGVTGSSGSVGNFNDYVSQAQNMYKAAAKPAIESLQASVPEIKSTVAGKTQILNERYKNLIDEIKGGQQKAENRQTVVTAGELGKRGIDPTSTLYGQELTSAVNPITSEYTGMLKSAATDQTAGQFDLANLETEQLANVRQTIANLQMGTDTNAINTAMQLYTQAQTNAANAASVAEAKRQNDIKNALEQAIYTNVTLPTSQSNIKKTASDISTSQAALANQKAWQAELKKILEQNNQNNTTGGLTLEQLQGIYGGNQTIGVGSNWEVIK
jgi:hypothetical protein